jgi:hypothetical protein
MYVCLYVWVFEHVHVCMFLFCVVTACPEDAHIGRALTRSFLISQRIASDALCRSGAIALISICILECT